MYGSPLSVKALSGSSLIGIGLSLSGVQRHFDQQIFVRRARLNRRYVHEGRVFPPRVDLAVRRVVFVQKIVSLVKLHKAGRPGTTSAALTNWEVGSAASTLR